jgi:hypothetical protein
MQIFCGKFSFLIVFGMCDVALVCNIKIFIYCSDGMSLELRNSPLIRYRVLILSLFVRFIKIKINIFVGYVIIEHF